MTMPNVEASVLLSHTATIVAAFVGNNSTRSTDLPEITRAVHDALSGIANPPIVPPPPELIPAVPVKKSVTQDHIICLEDGKKFRSLKRHLGTVYNMTPDEYRTKWGLAKDYPMVAPGYSEIRSKLAKDSGLGNKVEAAPPAPAEPKPKPSKAKKSDAPQSAPAADPAEQPQPSA